MCIKRQAITSRLMTAPSRWDVLASVPVTSSSLWFVTPLFNKAFFTVLCYEGVICELHIEKAVEGTIRFLF